MYNKIDEIEANHAHQLKTLKDTHSATLDELNEEHVSLIEDHKHTLSTLDSEHAAQLSKLTSSMEGAAQRKQKQHEEDLRLLHVRLEEEAAEWSSNLAITTTDLKASAQAALGDAAQVHEVAVKELEESHEAELEARHQAALLEAKAVSEAHHAQMEGMKNEHLEQVSDLNARHEAAVEEQKQAHNEVL